jgi:hypothetical protein
VTWFTRISCSRLWPCSLWVACQSKRSQSCLWSYDAKVGHFSIWFRSSRRPLWGTPRSCVYELGRAFGRFSRNWADPPVPNRRTRRCERGLGYVSLQRISPVRTEGSDHGACIPSRPFVTSQHHVGALARTLPPVLQCCGMVQRQPGDGRRHDRGLYLLCKLNDHQLKAGGFKSFRRT